VAVKRSPAGPSAASREAVRLTGAGWRSYPARSRSRPARRTDGQQGSLLSRARGEDGRRPPAAGAGAAEGRALDSEENVLTRRE
jgi:hypothetical protein